MSSSALTLIPLTLCTALSCSAGVADDGDTQAPARGMYPMQVLTPPMWQPRPPAWYRPDIQWQQHQPIEEASKVDEERPARSHWQRHAPDWINLPPNPNRTTLWKPQSLTPSAIDSNVTPVEVPPPDDALKN
ncbi:MAG: hypothetical protein H6981_10120 [Gammaproteobacteria bacterium]|nr:hypothetical protein [Gammaproteobacteria bacterium]MCP5137143.1 hypothetical protein [Gammaproteobacteria bacterium]